MSSHLKEGDEPAKSSLDASHLEVVGNPDELLDVAERVAEICCSPWTKSMFRLYGCLLISYFCGCLNGFDGSLMGGLNAMSSYQDTFNTYVPIPVPPFTSSNLRSAALQARRLVLLWPSTI
jgi:hypothetical protein